MLDNKFLPVIEGMLFINGDEGIKIPEVASLLKIKIKDLKLLLKKLDEEYIKNNHALKLIFFAEKYVRLTTRKDEYDYYVKLRTNALKNKTRKLSQASYETLSIILYNGPATRYDVENIRGVNSDSLIYRLKHLGLIKEHSRAETIGRPILYVVTDVFMKNFNINSFNDLPKITEDKEYVEMGKIKD